MTHQVGVAHPYQLIADGGAGNCVGVAPLEDKWKKIEPTLLKLLKQEDISRQGIIYNDSLL